MTEEELEILKAGLKEVVKETVNGKIDRLTQKVDEHNTRHEEHMGMVINHMERATPAIVAYEEAMATKKVLGNFGNGAKWLASVITAVGILWFGLIQLFK